MQWRSCHCGDDGSAMVVRNFEESFRRLMSWIRKTISMLYVYLVNRIFNYLTDRLECLVWFAFVECLSITYEGVKPGDINPLFFRTF